MGKKKVHRELFKNPGNVKFIVIVGLGDMDSKKFKEGSKRR